MSKQLFLVLLCLMTAASAHAEGTRSMIESGESPCFYFKESVDGKTKAIVEEVYVHSECLSAKGEAWIRGEMVEGAKDMMMDEPTYYGFRSDLRGEVIEAYNEQDESVFHVFMNTGVDELEPALTDSEQLQATLMPYNVERKPRVLSLPPENGEMLINVRQNYPQRRLIPGVSKRTIHWIDSFK